MMAANYRHSGGGGNRLGRHYNRFSRIWLTTFLADQSLALRKSQNAGADRRSRAKYKRHTYVRSFAEGIFGVDRRPIDRDERAIPACEAARSRRAGQTARRRDG